MKKSAAFILSLLVYVGCISLNAGTVVTWSTAKTQGEQVSIKTEQLNEHSYEVTVYSKGGLSEKQLLDLWAWKAAQLVDGHGFQNSAKVQPWTYEHKLEAEEAGIQMSGLMATGHVTLE